MVVILLAVSALASVGVGLYAVAAQSPSISSAPSDPTNQTSATFVYTHNKNVTRFECSLDASAFTACGTTRPSSKTYPGPLSPGSHVFQVRAVIGAQTTPAESYSWTIDTAAPSVSSIHRAGPSPTNDSPVSWTVTFSEAVIGVGNSDFQLVSSGLLLPLVNSTSGSGAIYTVAASTGLGSGTLALRLVDNDSIRDAAGNRLGGAGIGNGNFTGQAYSIDRVAPPTPVFTQTPPQPSPSGDATFAWTDSEPGVSFECKIKTGAWQVCTSPISFTLENNGWHRFAVRAVDAAGNRSDDAVYVWRVSTLGFTINGHVTDLSDNIASLYPGVWRRIRITITNPNNYTIYVSYLDVSVTASPPGCEASTNLEFQQSPLSSSNAFAVPANSTLTLDAANAPMIRLKDLPVNQDACQNTNFDLSYTGTATK